jgi:hypothetical protein
MDERFGISERSLHFKNHQELDIFVNKLEKKDQMIEYKENVVELWIHNIY